ncbi:MAG: phosphatidylglycerol lysyltransferase domain-containing protein [Candidatus Omnitrophica bacterium]|nr:phosphatidylglycerol lysyltransferase domain-containing protein [Candidatus Omnitrophota bacterium]
MGIPGYPDFRILEIGDLNTITEVLKANPPVISELTFTNIYCWKELYKPQVSQLNNFLIICSECVLERKFFVPIGVGYIKTPMEELLKERNCLFFRVPEAVKSLFDDNPVYRIEFDSDNSDYLFKTTDLTKLPGRKYDGKRNLIKKFKSFYNYEYLKVTSSWLMKPGIMS